ILPTDSDPDVRADSFALRARGARSERAYKGDRLQPFQRNNHRSSRVTPALTINTTTPSTVIPAKTPVVSNVPSACEITYPSPRVDPRYSPTTAPTTANPRLVCRLEKIQVSALGTSTCRTSCRSLAPSIRTLSISTWLASRTPW